MEEKEVEKEIEAPEKEVKEEEEKLETTKGTTYSCLFSTVHQKAGTTYSLIRKQSGSLKKVKE